MASSLVANQRFLPLPDGHERRSGNRGQITAQAARSGRLVDMLRVTGAHPRRWAIGRNRIRSASDAPPHRAPADRQPTIHDGLIRPVTAQSKPATRPPPVSVPGTGGGIKKVRSQKANGVDFLTTHFELLFSSLSSLLGDGGWCVGSITRLLRKTVRASSSYKGVRYMQPEIDKSVVLYNDQDFFRTVSELTKDEKQELLKMWAESKIDRV